ncbi:metal ABC transporter solute-binding protein, Zn/Mn family [Xylocopilactobacillus apicola]|uniref:Metal ABC transporter substrate-binding protein n=1 Tax=Xylocopilactobacillus apicola TaxID=2932184 RepID=A0AAU9DSJ8_9LACO|nr:zinc ABC transporter substrate-binding protein [Xylocopilactobacillus apicola]BDR59029.1 metal ABC transporter substrate-binding protein [Xylocopilactobacillus apicola]
MKKNRKIIMLIAALLVLLCLGLVIFGIPHSKNEKAKSSQLQIVTSTDIYADITRQIVGKEGSVTAIIENPNIDPHDFKPTTKTTKAVTQADLVISNGLGYDNWINPLITKQKHIDIGKDVAGKKTGANPHLWFDLEIIEKYTNNLADQLGKMQPAHKSYFTTNAKNYQAKLKKVEAKAKKSTANPDKNQVDVSEPLFDYALTNLGYKINNPRFALAIENETDPSPKDAQATIDDFKDHRVIFYVHNRQVENNTTDTLLKEAKAQKIPVLFLTEMKPAGVSYLDWQNKIYDELAKILKN